MHALVFGEGQWEVREGAPSELAALAKQGPVWIRTGGASADEFHAVGAALGLHPLAMEDARNARQRPKVEAYPDQTFVVIRVPRLQEGMDIAWQPAALFLGPNFLLTASSDHVPELDTLQGRLHLRRSSMTPDRLMHAALDAMVDAWFPVMDGLEDRIEDLEDLVLMRAEQDTLTLIRDAKALLSRMRKVVGPMRDAMLALERAEHPHISPETRLFLRDVSDHMVRLAERLEHVKEVTLIAQETWNATLANQQNQVMKRLTVVAALLLLPGLLAGLGGMNFDGIPDWNYWHVTGSILGMIAVGLSIAWWQRWL